MKTIKIFAALLMGLSVAACSGQPSGETLPKEFRSTKAEVDSVSYLIGINFGSWVKNYDFGSDLNATEIAPDPADVAGFNTWLAAYQAAFPIERAAIECKR